MLKTEDIRIRDPYIVAYDGSYYMYGTIGETKNERSLYVFRGQDLLCWEEPKKIFTLDENSWGLGELWAPEVHFYKGKYYLFVSILGKHGKRGTQIAVCDTPCGMFLPIADKPATPFEKSCIDGTLYVENGVPYIVYSADWPDNYDKDKDVYIGEICAAELSEDLKNIVSEPFRLFESTEAPLSRVPAVHDYMGKKVTRYGSDGPFIRKLKDGSLFLTWSPIPDMNYIVAAAIQRNGEINGKWEHLETPVFDKNGGHAMFFEDLNGNLKICMHYPEVYFEERALILDAEETKGGIRLV